MIALIGTLALWLAVLCAMAQTVSGARMLRHDQVHAAGRKLADAHAIFLGIAFLSALTAFAMSDYSIQTVYKNSHSTKPMLYKITGTWGNHEGSILLWALISAIYGAVFAAKTRLKIQPKLYGATVMVMGLVGLGITLYTAILSNPLEVMSGPVPADGLGMNPVLQDIGIAIHPPMLYLGYVGLVIPFALAIAAMLAQTEGKDWARIALPWTYIALGFLTLGIMLGAWWAYRELGWGGWWFWDPVENVSFMPWLIAVALAHSLIALRVRGLLMTWSIFLAIAAFGSSLLGAFLVRSGVLVSVHSFAAAPGRGIALLTYLVALVGFALVVFVVRPPRQNPSQTGTLFSREGFLNIHNLLAITAMLTVLLGTLYPVIIQALNKPPMSVGAQYFSAIVTPILIAAIVFMAVAPAAPWRKGTWQHSLRQILLPAVIGGVAAAAVLGMTHAGPKAIVAFGAGALLAAAILRHGRGQSKMAKPQWALIVSHLGVAIFVIGAAASYGWARTFSVDLRPGESAERYGYTVTLNKIATLEGPNYFAARADAALKTQSGRTTRLMPEYRVYHITGKPTTEADIRTRITGDTHITLNTIEGTDPDNPRWALKVQTRPLQIWVWIGTLLTTLGIFMAAKNRWRDLPKRQKQKDIAA